MTTQQQSIGEIRSVLIPMNDMTLLLPNAAVAEVIDFRLPKAIQGSPDWLSGSVNWRQRSLPVVVLESLMGQAVTKPGVRQRIAVCHAQSSQARFPYIGLVAQGIPRLVRLSEEAITQVEGATESADVPVHAKVLIGDQEAWIPDLNKIEAYLNAIFQG